jgi:hypothetical protein
MELQPIEKVPERLSINVKRELFRFNSQQEWVNTAKNRYANCGVQKGFYLAVDSGGNVVHMGKCFMQATRQDLYPITVYELQKNWADEA